MAKGANQYKMNRKLTCIVGAGVMAAGLLGAQVTQPQPSQRNTASRGAKRGAHGMGRLAKVLDLTPDQRTQAKQIFASSAESNKAVATDLRQARKALADAAKNNASDAEIDRLSQDVGGLAARVTANRTKAFAKLYSILTPEQRQKMDQTREHGARRGMRRTLSQ